MTATALFLLLFVVAMYFAPTIRAYKDRKRDTAAIAALNILLGWTFIGWVIALVWALKSDPGDGPRRW